MFPSRLTSVLAGVCLFGCATQRPLPTPTVPRTSQHYRSNNAEGEVLLDVVDGPALVRIDTPTPPWPTLCATPCNLALARGGHRLTLIFNDEQGRVIGDRVTVQVSEQPTVHRHSLSRYKVDHRGAFHTATVLELIGLGLVSGGLGSLLWVNEKEDLVVPGVLLGTGAILFAGGIALQAFAGRRLRANDLVFAMPATAPR